MGVALNVLLLAVAVIGVVAGIGALLALRVPPRRPGRAARPTTGGSTARPAAGGRPVSAAQPASAGVAKTAHPAPAGDNVASRLAAMRELLARGDREHAERAAKGDSQQFADTQAFDEDYPPTMTIPRGTLLPPSPLLNLDKAAHPPKADPAAKRRA